MRTQVAQSPHLLMWIASVAATLFCSAGIAAFMAWAPTAIGNPKDHATFTGLSPMSDQPAVAKGAKDSADVLSDTPIRTTCAECGVIESLREIQLRAEQAAESTRSYEFIVRFRDGSTRVFNEATPRIWRFGRRGQSHSLTARTTGREARSAPRPTMNPTVRSA